MNRFKKSGRSFTASFVLCSALLILLLYDVRASSQQLYRGLVLCGKSLIPSLFPYMVISEMLVRSGAVSFFAPALSRFSRRIFAISGYGAAAMLIGAVCGFPVGAKITAELYEKELITPQEAERLPGLCSIPSAPFIIIAVGEKLFGSRRIGLFLYSVILLSALLCGVVTARDKMNHTPQRKEFHLPEKLPPLPDVFTDSISSAASSVIKICAYVAFFSAAIGGFSSIAARLSPTLRVGVLSFLELSTAAAACSSLADRRLGIILVSAAAGWSGLSVFCQIRSVTRTARGSIPLRPYISMKAASALFCALLTSICILAFPSLVTSLPPVSDTAALISVYPKEFVSAANVFFIASYLIYLYKKLDRRRKI
jgi:sporulation integral membrane protein YlbJ